MKSAFLMLAATLLILPEAGNAQSRVTFLPGWQMEDGRRMAGIRIQLEPGWKTYWRSPEGNGIPPQFDWGGSSNVADIKVHYPEPMIFTTYGVRSIGYQNEVVFPVEVTPQDTKAPVDVALDLFYGVCEEVCIPATAAIAASVPPDAESEALPVRLALATRARNADEAGIRHHTCKIIPATDGFDVVATVSGSAPITPDVAVFETGREDLWITPLSIQPHASNVIIHAHMAYFGDGTMVVDRSALRLTLLGPGGAIELEGCPAA
ncbi:MAG: protein-disulfide reductase DsbD domain-containing protein [Pseudomonadota bacterium]